MHCESCIVWHTFRQAAKSFRCIFQDDLADWSREAKVMGQIYSQSVCTIAATASHDSHGGLFLDRKPELLQPKIVEVIKQGSANVEDDMPELGTYWCDLALLWEDYVNMAPLSRRGWVHQERHLSPRIIHFTEVGPFWECHKYRASENYPQGFPAWLRSHYTRDYDKLKRVLHQLKLSGSSKTTREITEKEIYFAWCQFRSGYASSAVTVDSDKLIAIQGIAEQVGTVLEDTLIAGLWRKRLLEDLCWEAGHLPCRSTGRAWRAPSWSWASIDEQHVNISWISVQHRACKDLHTCASIIDIRTGTSCSGVLSYSNIRLQCRPLRVYCNHDQGLRPYFFDGTLRFAQSGTEIDCADDVEASVDLRIEDEHRSRNRLVYLVIIQRCPHSGGSALGGLILSPLFKHEGVFERIGSWTATALSSGEIFMMEHEAVHESVITLI